MKSKRLILVAVIFFTMISPGKLLSQAQKFEIRGTLSGKHFGKIYLFFDNDYQHRYTNSAEIKNGNFIFRGVTTLPILARFHLEQNSYVVDVYMDQPTLTIDLSNIVIISADKKDTANQIALASSKGSVMDQKRSGFERSLKALKSLNIPDDKKQALYFEKLSVFVSTNRSSKVSPYLIGKGQNFTYTQLKQLSQMLDTSLQSTFEMKGVNKMISILDRSKFREPGMLFRDVDLPDTTGRIMSTKAFQKKFTYYKFWASWCAPCRREHPELRGFYDRNKMKGLEIVGISLDTDKTKWMDAITKDGLAWPQLSDLKGYDTGLSRYFGIEEIPAGFLVDAKGRIVAFNVSFEEMESLINGN